MKQTHRGGSAREEYIPATLESILLAFAPCFTAPSLENFVAIVSGWILCSGRRCISRVIQAACGSARTKHFSTLYRFLSRARWSADHLGEVLFRLLLRWLPEDIDAMVDDTLCHRGGPHIFAGGMHHDTSRSTYGGGHGRRTLFSFGQNWVVLALRVPMPWDPDRGVALPILFRLYRSKKRCPETLYRKRTELAAELVGILETWIPPSHRLYLSGDAEYACRTLVPGLSKKTTFIGPMHMDAALHDPPGKYAGFGRPRKTGRRLLSPRQLAATTSIPWEQRTVRFNGREVAILTKTMTCLWRTVAGERLVCMVITRDPPRP